LTHGLDVDVVVIVVVVTCAPAVSDEAVGVGAVRLAGGDDCSKRTTPPALCGLLYIRCRTPAKLGDTSENVCPRKEDGLLVPRSDTGQRRATRNSSLVPSSYTGRRPSNGLAKLW